MRFVLAAALAVSVAGAAWAVEPAKSVSEASKASAMTQVVETKEWNSSQCWVCLPWWEDK
jgi:hypothetical protein